MTQQTKPEGVSQYLWDRATGASPYGFNPTLITRDPATRDALIAAGYEDFVKKAHEKHMEQAASHWSGNGATDDVWARANDSVTWYQDNYGAYTGPAQAASSPAQAPSGPGGMFGGVTNHINTSVRPPETTSSGGGGSTGGGSTGGGGSTPAPVLQTIDTGQYQKKRLYECVRNS